ncbi:hypothetical protein M404DRAFT_212587 [Pisolithus tinctorius Marx 270]|uniref:Uncharacterized protein n=1 Tax=Pisolithus tinctorius Marx 270 TaxID=870435 RepID=A0A0C3P8L0_PISTI|nr:hypothetical protein M404DRAFT_212587 [Pisolithus tinctorius Marx 270]
MFGRLERTWSFKLQRLHLAQPLRSIMSQNRLDVFSQVVQNVFTVSIALNLRSLFLVESLRWTSSPLDGLCVVPYVGIHHSVVRAIPLFSTPPPNIAMAEVLLPR